MALEKRCPTRHAQTALNGLSAGNEEEPHKLPRQNCTQKSSLQSNPHCCITLRSPLNQHDFRLLQIARQVLVQSTLRDRPCDCSMATQPKEGIFLPGLARAFEAVNTSDHISTLEFAKAVEAILPVFDRLGEVSGTGRPSGQALKPSRLPHR